MHERLQREKGEQRLLRGHRPGRVGLLLLKTRKTVDGVKEQMGSWAGGGAGEEEESGLGCGFLARERQVSWTGEHEFKGKVGVDTHTYLCINVCI